MNAIKQLIPQCLKITEKVSFNTASEVSYVYILNGQKLIKNADFGDFCKPQLVFKKCYQTGQFLLDKD